MSNSSDRQNEDHTSSAPAAGSRHHTRSQSKMGVALGLGLTSALLTVALISSFYDDPSASINPTKTPPPQPTSSTPPNNLPRAFVGREGRDLGRTSAVDRTSSESYPNLHLDDIADGVFTTAGSSEARSISNQDRWGES